jgi:hypothetical protein
MECRFSIEAKAFYFTMKDGSSNLRLEERMKGFDGFILVGPQSSIWLAAKVEEVFLSWVKEVTIAYFREDENVLMVRGGRNKAGKFLEVAIYTEGGRKGVIWLPEGKNGWGWRCFVGELRRMMEFQGGKVGPIMSEFPSLPGKQLEVGVKAPSGPLSGRSFVDMLQSKVGGLKRPSSCLLNMIPMSANFEAKQGGVEPRSAMDCYVLEVQQIPQKKFLGAPLPVVQHLAVADLSASMEKMQEWVKLHLGLLRSELDQAFVGLAEGLVVRLDLTSNGRQNRATRLDLAGLGVGSSTGLDPDLDLGHNSDHGPDHLFGTWFGS